MSFLVRMWAYVSLGAMAFIVEEASPLFGGLAARDRHMHLSAVIIAVAIGTWAAGFALYLLGRWRGHWLRKRYPRFRKLLLQSIALVRRHPWRAALAVRYAWGLRLPIPIACGIGRVPLYIFSIGTAISCITWSLIFSLLGWWLGDATETLIGHVKQWEPYIGAVLVIAMIVGFVVVRRRHIPQRIERALDRESLPPAKEP
jgi:membrane protein DedA with SNARE-associated domain